MKIVKIAMCRYTFGDEYVYKIYRLKEDGIWYKVPGTSFDCMDRMKALAKALGV
jgi:hypothetical protein